MLTGKTIQRSTLNLLLIISNLLIVKGDLFDCDARPTKFENIKLFYIFKGMAYLFFEQQKYLTFRAPFCYDLNHDLSCSVSFTNELTMSKEILNNTSTNKEQVLGYIVHQNHLKNEFVQVTYDETRKSYSEYSVTRDFSGKTKSNDTLDEFKNYFKSKDTFAYLFIDEYRNASYCVQYDFGQNRTFRLIYSK